VGGVRGWAGREGGEGKGSCDANKSGAQNAAHRTRRTERGAQNAPLRTLNSLASSSCPSFLPTRSCYSLPVRPSLTCTPPSPPSSFQPLLPPSSPTRNLEALHTYTNVHQFVPTPVAVTVGQWNSRRDVGSYSNLKRVVKAASSVAAPQTQACTPTLPPFKRNHNTRSLSPLDGKLWGSKRLR